jgi:hypothetical protein
VDLARGVSSLGSGKLSEGSNSGFGGPSYAGKTKAESLSKVMSDEGMQIHFSTLPVSASTTMTSWSERPNVNTILLPVGV